MNDQIRLGANIRSLRLAYGETQEELGFAIYVEKTTVSQYESGKRIPNSSILKQISEHYGISVEELTEMDFSALGSIQISLAAVCENIDVFLPIAVTERALSNESFKKAYCLHTDFFARTKKLEPDCFAKFDLESCFDNYLKAVNSVEAAEEAAANIIGFIMVAKAQARTVPLLEKGPAFYTQVMEHDAKFSKRLERSRLLFETDKQQIMETFASPKLDDMMSKCMKVIKSSSRWADLADYYLALRYCWNVVDSGLSPELNARIGAEMMDSFISVGNHFAMDYSELGLKIMGWEN